MLRWHSELFNVKQQQFLMPLMGIESTEKLSTFVSLLDSFSLSGKEEQFCLKACLLFLKKDCGSTAMSFKKEKHINFYKVDII